MTDISFWRLKTPNIPMRLDRAGTEFVRGCFWGTPLNEDLKYKYRDSFLYEWAAGRADKPVHYFVLIADDALTDLDLTSRTDALARNLPLRGPRSGSWTRRIVDHCVVFNVKSWRRTMPQYPLDRLSPPS